MPREPEPIPGSRYVRDICRGCGEPMRVPYSTFDKGPSLCSTCEHACDGEHLARMWDYLTPRQQIGKGKTQ